jgi:hypothetical protein
MDLDLLMKNPLKARLYQELRAKRTTQLWGLGYTAKQLFRGLQTSVKKLHTIDLEHPLSSGQR